MNTGAFGEGFPYTNFHELNMDWIVKIAKDFLDQYTHLQETIANGEQSIRDLTAEELEALQNKATQLEGLLQSWYDTHSSDIANQLAQAITDFQETAQRTVDTIINDIPQDYSELSDMVATLKTLATYNEYRFVNGNNNIYNYRAIEEGYVLTNAGVESEVATGYTSFPIPVSPSTQYHKRYVFGSANIADVCFYTNDMTYISSSANGDGTFTTPSNCVFIRACGYIANSAGDVIEKGSSYTGHHFYKGVLSPLNGGADYAYFTASSPIIYSREEGKLYSLYNDGTGKIHLLIPSKEEKVFDSPITVTGSGAYLYYNENDDSFFCSTTEVGVDSNYYRLGEITAFSGKQYRADADSLFLIGNNAPLLEFDYIHYKVNVTIPSATYVWYKQSFSAITAETYELEFGTGNWLLYFNVITKKFIIHNNFTDYRNYFELVPVAYFRNGIIQCIIPYKVKSVDNKLYGKKIITYGDSLTWYDGQTFNTGAEQGNVCYGYQSYLTRYYGAVITNKGANGASTPEIYGVINSDSSDLTTYDYVIFMPSIDNDMRTGVSVGTVQPIGSTFATNTTAGAIQESIEHILTENPSIRLVIMSEPKGWVYRNNAPLLNNINYYNTIKEIAELYSLPFIDLWKESGINDKTRNTFINDPSFESGNDWYMFHPNNKGWEVISRIVCNNMEKY